MTTTQSQEVKEPQGSVQDQELQFGPGRQEGTAGDDAVYVLRSVERWRLRGDGTLK